MSQLLTIIDKHAPVIRRTINVRPKQPWRTDDLQRMKQQVRRAQLKWRHARLTVYREIYVDLRDAFKQSIASAKSAYYCAEIKSSAHNNKEMYCITNDLMGRFSKPSFLKCDDGPGALADCFVTHFTDKITHIRIHLATISTQRQLSVFADDNDCRVVDPLCDIELATGNDICNLVMKGTSKLSSDIDITSATLLKSNMATLTPVLTRSVNLSIESSTMSAIMKHAVVTPLLKKSDLDPKTLDNYRPISNLSFISKLLEKYVASQIRQYMDANDLFDVFQSAYRPAHSCETALVRIQDDILHSLDNRNTVILVLLDFSAAFDTVDHRLLLDTLHEIGIRDNAHR